VFRKLSIGLMLNVMCLSTTAMADTVSDLSQLLEKGESVKAYQLSLDNLDEMEGDPAFDFQYGVAAIDSGHLSEGIFALERVHMLEPRNSLATLELARGYYLIAQYDRAQVLFQQVDAENPPEVVRARIQQFLALITEKTSISPTKFKSFVELWTGYDSNINSGPGGQTNVVILSDNALGRGDQYAQVKVGASVEHAYNPDNALMFSANVDSRIYDTEDEQDYNNINLSAGHVWKGETDQFQLNFNLQKYQLANNNYRDMLGMTGSWSKQLSKTSVMKFFAGVSDLAYDDQAWKDATLRNLGATYIYAGEGGWRPLYFVGAFVGDEDPKTAGILANGQVDRFFYGGNIGVQLTPVKDLKLTPVLTYQTSEYKGKDWIYNIKRKDDFAMFNVNMEWTVAPSWTVLANYSFTDIGSNIELYEYDRQQAMLGLRYNFQ